MSRKSGLIVLASAALVLGLGFKDINNHRPNTSMHKVILPAPPTANVWIGNYQVNLETKI